MCDITKEETTGLKSCLSVSDDRKSKNSEEEAFRSAVFCIVILQLYNLQTSYQRWIYTQMKPGYTTRHPPCRGLLFIFRVSVSGGWARSWSS